MLQPNLRPRMPPSATPRTSVTAAAAVASRPFFGALDSITMDEPAEFKFSGAVGRAEAAAVWVWLVRDIAPDLIDPQISDCNAETLAAQQAIAPTLLVRAEHAMAAAASNPDAERRLKGQLGSSEVFLRLPVVLHALKCLPLLDKARAFGRAINDITDEEAIVTALQSMPRQDADVAAVLMTAAVGQVVNPTRLIVAATQIAGEASEPALQRIGFSPLIEACLAQAQNTVPPLLQVGAFADIDLICRAVERFHRLSRAVAANIELSRGGRWASIIAALTKTVSDRLEPRLRELMPDVNQSLRPPREGGDRADSDRLLSALNGFYLLATVRDCRDSLALNQVFDEIWARTGQALEMHLERNIEALRDNPADPIAAARLDGGIKMSELRFGAEYAQVLRRARDGIERRLASSN